MTEPRKLTWSSNHSHHELWMSHGTPNLRFMEDGNILLTVSDVADVLDLTPDGVRRLSDRGDIDTLRTLGGMRLFRLRDVHELKDARAGKPRTGRPRIHPRRKTRTPSKQGRG